MRTFEHTSISNPTLLSDEFLYKYYGSQGWEIINVLWQQDCGWIYFLKRDVTDIADTEQGLFNRLLKSMEGLLEIHKLKA